MTTDTEAERIDQTDSFKAMEAILPPWPSVQDGMSHWRTWPIHSGCGRDILGVIQNGHALIDLCPDIGPSDHRLIVRAVWLQCDAMAFG